MAVSRTITKDQANDSLSGSRPPSFSDIKKILEWEKNKRDDLEAKKLACEQINSVVEVTDYISGTISDSVTIVSALSKIFNVLKIISSVLPQVRIIVTALSILFNFIQFATGLVLAVDIKTEGKATGIYKATTALVGIGFALASIPVITLVPFMIYVGIAADTLFNIWNLGITIAKFIFGSWPVEKQELKEKQRQFYTGLANYKSPKYLTPIADKRIYELLDARRAATKAKVPLDLEISNEIVTYGLDGLFELDADITRKTNLRREHYGEFVDKAHECMQNIVSQLGGMLLYTFPIVGAAMIGAVAAYSMLDRYNLNPLRWIGNKLFGNPFSKLDNHQTTDQIKRSVDRLRLKTKTQIVEKQSAEPCSTAALTKIMDSCQAQATVSLPPTDIQHKEVGTPIPPVKVTPSSDDSVFVPKSDTRSESCLLDKKKRKKATKVTFVEKLLKENTSPNVTPATERFLSPKGQKASPLIQRCSPIASPSPRARRAMTPETNRNTFRNN